MRTGGRIPIDPISASLAFVLDAEPPPSALIEALIVASNDPTTTAADFATILALSASTAPFAPLEALTLPSPAQPIEDPFIAALAVSSSSDPYILPTLAKTVSSPADPTPTASAVGVMMGLAGTITPLYSSTVRFTITGDIANDTIGDGVAVQLYTGIGAAPASGAALTGTGRGSIKRFTAAANNQRVPFCVDYYVTGLVRNTAVWVDIALAAITGGTASAADIDVVAIEMF